MKNPTKDDTAADKVVFTLMMAFLASPFWYWGPWCFLLAFILIFSSTWTALKID
jgi:hypothetical protein